MQLFVAQRPDMREEEIEDIKQFKKTTISCYLRCLDGRSCWTTLIRYSPVLLHSPAEFHPQPPPPGAELWFQLLLLAVVTLEQKCDVGIVPVGQLCCQVCSESVSFLL